MRAGSLVTSVMGKGEGGERIAGDGDVGRLILAWFEDFRGPPLLPQPGGVYGWWHDDDDDDGG